MLLFITGSNFYDHENFSWESVKTKYGTAEFLRGEIANTEVIILPRHGKDHKNLPNHINYLANAEAIKTLQPKAVISFSVCGVLNTEIPLGNPIVPQDFFFPENRLPDGKLCTIFQDNTEEKGHLLPTGNFLDDTIQSNLAEICSADFSPVPSGTYIHSNGPRFNSKTEISYFQSVGGDMISQTCGPEIVLTNELEIPFGMLCFGIDYANGVSETPSSIEELNTNLAKSTAVFKMVIEKMVENGSEYKFGNFVYKI